MQRHGHESVLRMERLPRLLGATRRSERRAHGYCRRCNHDQRGRWGRTQQVDGLLQFILSLEPGHPKANQRQQGVLCRGGLYCPGAQHVDAQYALRSEEHTSELQSRLHLVCRLLLEKKKEIASTTAMSMSSRQRCSVTCSCMRSGESAAERWRSAVTFATTTDRYCASCRT